MEESFSDDSQKEGVQTPLPKYDQESLQDEAEASEAVEGGE